MKTQTIDHTDLATRFRFALFPVVRQLRQHNVDLTASQASALASQGLFLPHLPVARVFDGPEAFGLSAWLRFHHHLLKLNLLCPGRAEIAIAYLIFHRLIRKKKFCSLR